MEGFLVTSVIDAWSSGADAYSRFARDRNQGGSNREEKYTEALTAITRSREVLKSVQKQPYLSRSLRVVFRELESDLFFKTVAMTRLYQENE